MTEEPFHAFAFDGVLGLGSMCSVKGWRNDSEKVSNDAIYDIDLQKNVKLTSLLLCMRITSHQNTWTKLKVGWRALKPLAKLGPAVHENHPVERREAEGKKSFHWVLPLLSVLPHPGTDMPKRLNSHGAYVFFVHSSWICQGMESSTAGVDSLHQGPHFRISSVHHLIPLPNKSQYITIQNGWVTQDNAICSVMAVMANMYQLLTYLSLGTFKSILDGYRRRPVVHIGRLHFRSLVFKIRRNFVLSKHPSNLYQTDLVF